MSSNISYCIRLFIIVILASPVLSCGLSSPNREMIKRAPSSQIELDSICIITRDSFLRMNTIEKHCQQMGMDSVLVEYYDTQIYDIKYSGGKITLLGYIPRFKYQIFDIETIDRFINFIDVFFVTKNEIVEIARKKTGDIIVADYPCLFITVYLKKRVIKETVTIGNEMYNIEYNPLFLEFYEFVDNIKQF